MKNLKTALAGLTFCAALFFTGCSPDYDNVSTTEEVLTRNAWQIDHFSRSSQNLTSEFSNNTLYFSDNGTLICRNGSNQCNGKWSYSSANTGETIFIQLINADARMQQLNQSWQLAARNLSNMQLQQADANGNSELRIRIAQ